MKDPPNRGHAPGCLAAAAAMSKKQRRLLQRLPIIIGPWKVVSANNTCRLAVLQAQLRVAGSGIGVLPSSLSQTNFKCCYW
jgi:hypothetical protein